MIVILVACVLTPIPVCNPSALAAQDPLYIAAKAEGQVTVYEQGPPILTDLFARFERKYPGVKVRVVFGRYELGKTIDNQLASDRLEPDVVVLQTLLDFDRWNRRGELLKFEPEGYSQTPRGLKVPERGFYAIGFSVSGIGYNRAMLSGAPAPRTIAGLIDPAYRGKLASTYPHDDETTLWRYSQIVDKYGWAFVERLIAQDVRFVRSHYALGQLVAGGTRPITLEQHSAFSKNEMVAPGDFKLLGIPLAAAAMAKAPHKNSAKLLLRFAFSKEGQASLVERGFFPIRRDIPVPVSMQSLRANPIDFGYLRFLRQVDRNAALKDRFHALIGEPEGDYQKSITPQP